MKKLSIAMRGGGARAFGLFLALTLAALSLNLSAEGSAAISATSGDRPAHLVLPNGLEIFVVENHSVPLATVCVAFRGGASAQDKSDAGLFHLYEHLLFASNEKYPNQAAFTAALNSLGVPDWNGSTGGQDIEYHITIPSSKLDDGVQFWSWAVRHPVFDPAKLETEKGVVLNEIKGYHADPDQIFENALDSRAFSTYPWRKNVDGPESNVEGATVADLKAMQAAWYVPSNAAILVGGDVKPAEVFASVKKWFGDWQGAPAQAIGVPPQPSFPGDIRLLYKDSGYYKGIDNVRVQWRGPDVLVDTKNSYVSDVLLFLTRSPVGRFKKDLMEKVPDLYDPEYIDFGYPTARDGGVLYFNSYMRAGEGGAILDRAEALRKAVIDELALIAKDPRTYFGDEELALAKRKLVDDNLLSMEDTSSFVSGVLVFWWSVASSDYFYNYEENCRKVSFDDISALIRSYILDRPSELGVRVNSSDAAKDAAMDEGAKSLGYENVTPADAFWWQQQGGK
ncbi:MAG TPA: pitrilysin family protein [Rectinemataceae bacterium]|nr:pitrilysin family protein [Rectinemataceae bacterium]